MAETAYVHFSVEGDRFAVPLDEIREVARVGTIAPVPRAPAVIRGLANIRGRVVTLIDMDVVYGREAQPATAAEKPAAAERSAVAQAAAAPPGAGHAVVLAPPRDHLALFTRSRVDIGRGGPATLEGPAPQPAPAASRSIESDSGQLPRLPAGARVPAGALVVCNGEVAHLVSAAEVADHCEERILARYRRRG